MRQGCGFNFQNAQDAMDHQSEIRVNDQLEDVIYALKNNRLTKLSLPHCELRDAEAERIAEAIQQCETLEQLDLSWNYITDSGAQQLVKAFHLHPNLRSIDLTHNICMINGTDNVVGLNHLTRNIPASPNHFYEKANLTLFTRIKPTSLYEVQHCAEESEIVPAANKKIWEPAVIENVELTRPKRSLTK